MAQGAFMEQFDIELHKVLVNIMDPNTNPTKPRKITLTATLKPDENRELVSFAVQSKAALVPAKPLSTVIMVDKAADGGEIVLVPPAGARGLRAILRAPAGRDQSE